MLRPSRRRFRDALRLLCQSIRLAELMGSYTGPDVVLDFDQDGVLVGIEILA